MTNPGTSSVQLPKGEGQAIVGVLCTGAKIAYQSSPDMAQLRWLVLVRAPALAPLAAVPLALS